MANCSTCKLGSVARVAGELYATECTTSSSTGPTCNRLRVIAVNFHFQQLRNKPKVDKLLRQMTRVPNLPCTIIGFDEPNCWKTRLSRTSINGRPMPRMLTGAVCCLKEFRRTEVFIIIHVFLWVAFGFNKANSCMPFSFCRQYTFSIANTLKMSPFSAVKTGFILCRTGRILSFVSHGATAKNRWA